MLNQKTSPQDETEMMRQASAYLAYHCSPPSVDSPESDEWWIQAINEAEELYSAWNGHPLFREVLFVLIDYIESKVRKAVNEADEV